MLSYLVGTQYRTGTFNDLAVLLCRYGLTHKRSVAMLCGNRKGSVYLTLYLIGISDYLANCETK